MVTEKHWRNYNKNLKHWTKNKVTSTSSPKSWIRNLIK